jgi:hypothetical protein
MTLKDVLDVATVATLMMTATTGLIVARRVGVVHNLVNQQHTDLKNYQAALIRALEAQGIEVPIDQSAPPTTSRPVT